MKKLSALFCLGLFALVSHAEPAAFKRTQDVIYGFKPGVALTMDVIQPAKPNGYGIIFVVSGGWVSMREAINPIAYQAMLDRGYTVFAVVHGSQPKYTISEIIPDMHRAVRFIRHNAVKYGIDPNKIGVVGGSAGGHLSLVLGTGEGGATNPNAKDPVDQESSAVQCVVAFFPPTDFLNYGAIGEEAETTNGTLTKFRPAFGPLIDTAEGRQKLGHEISPIYFVTSNLPPTLLIHGDADPLVPIQQSQSFIKRAKELGDTVKLIVKPGAGHGWKDWIATDMPVAADWFDEYLRGIKIASMGNPSTNHPAGKR